MATSTSMDVGTGVGLGLKPSGHLELDAFEAHAHHLRHHRDLLELEVIGRLGDVERVDGRRRLGRGGRRPLGRRRLEDGSSPLWVGRRGSSRDEAAVGGGGGGGGSGGGERGE